MPHPSEPKTNEVQTAKAVDPAAICSVEYHLEGQIGQAAGPWNLIEQRSELKAIRSEEADYRSWMDESNWHDFRIVKVTTTREILPPNVKTVATCATGDTNEAKNA